MEKITNKSIQDELKQDANSLPKISKLKCLSSNAFVKICFLGMMPVH